jgi:hypothetical protein
VPSRDQSFTVSSFEHDANAFNSGTSVKHLTMSSWAFSMTFSCFPLNQILIALSWLPVIVMPFANVKTAVAWVWPVSFSFARPVSKSQTIAVPSHEPLTNSSLIACDNELTAAVWSLNCLTGLPSKSIWKILLSLPAEIKPSPLIKGMMQRTKPSWYLTSRTNSYRPV